MGQFIDYGPLQDQCCKIVSALLKTHKDNRSKDGIDVLGEQLQVHLLFSYIIFFIGYYVPSFSTFFSLVMQFLVSKLVECCIPKKSDPKHSITQPSEALSLLHLLVVDSDPSLHKHIKVCFFLL